MSIKDRIESIGIPHPEVAMILKNGEAINFNYLVKENDFFSVYPHFYNFKIPNSLKLREEYEGKLSFILDVHLGKLAKYLRRFNFDTAYRNDYTDEEIVEIANKDKRIILSRDHGLLKRKEVKWAMFISYDSPRKQLKEVFDRYNLFAYYDGENTRCINCNHKLIKVEKSEIIDRLEPKTKKYFNDFKLCPNCNKIYWEGSHYKRTEKLIRKLK